MKRVAPAKVRQEAKLGLELHKKWKRGGTSVGVARAVQLSSGKAVSDQTVKRMFSYFQRHQHDRLDKDGSDGSIPGRGYIAWLLWGGDSGRKWAEREYKKLQGKKRNPITKSVAAIKKSLAQKHIKVTLDEFRSEAWAQDMVTKEEDFEVVDNYTHDGEPIFKTSEFVYAVLPKKYLQDLVFTRRMVNEGKVEKLTFTSACRAWLDNDQPLDWFNEQAHDRGYIDQNEYLFLVKVNNPIIKPSPQAFKQSNPARNIFNPEAIKNHAKEVIFYMRQGDITDERMNEIQKWLMSNYVKGIINSESTENYFTLYSDVIAQEDEPESDDEWIGGFDLDHTPVERPEWVKKALEKGEKVYYFPEEIFGDAPATAFFHLTRIDLAHFTDFASSESFPRNISRISFDQMWQLVRQWDEKNKKAKLVELKEGSDEIIFKEYDNGFKWVRLLTIKSLKNEAVRMGGLCIADSSQHSGPILKGKHFALSLRDEKGEPLVTVEYVGEKNTKWGKANSFVEIKGYGNGEYEDYGYCVADLMLAMPNHNILATIQQARKDLYPDFSGLQFTKIFEGELSSPSKVEIYSSDYKGKEYYGSIDCSEKKQNPTKKQNPLSLIAKGVDERPASAYDREELKLGIKTELEHTDDAIIASKIAKDHLDEDPHYYSKLVEMEKKMKNPINSSYQSIKKALDSFLNKRIENYRKNIIEEWDEYKKYPSNFDEKPIEPKSSEEEKYINKEIMKNKNLHVFIDEIEMAGLSDEFLSLLEKIGSTANDEDLSDIESYTSDDLDEMLKGFSKKLQNLILDKGDTVFFQGLFSGFDTEGAKIKKQINPEFMLLGKILSKGKISIMKNPITSSLEKSEEYLPLVQKIVDKEYKGADVWIDEESADILIGNLAFEADRSFDDVYIRIKTNGRILEGESVDDSMRKFIHKLMKKIHMALAEYVVRKPNPKKRRNPEDPMIQYSSMQTENKTSNNKKNDIYVFVICKTNDKIAILKSKESNKIEIPGGLVKKGENPRNALIRISMEQGIKLDGLEKTYFKKWDYQWNGLNAYWFYCDNFSIIDDYSMENEVSLEKIEIKQLNKLAPGILKELEIHLKLCKDPFFCKKYKQENPVPAGVDPKEFDDLVKKLKKRKDVDNPYALANWILKQKNPTPYEKLVKQLEAKGAQDPRALAAWIGRQKYGEKKFQEMAAKGKKKIQARKLKK